MLPIYNAITVTDILKHGGRTFPWVILVETDISVKPFVVKLFKPEDIERHWSVESEVIGNILAKYAFDLKVPDAALINFTPEFYTGLSDTHKIILEKIDTRIKFGTELIDNFYPYSTATPKAYIEKKIALDTLFAFDYLIRNRDRTDRKPNILIKKDDVFLIDHELAFEKMDMGIGELMDNGSPLN